jgi:dTDP-4-amino-4,6-dideoxygalactose transaminase
VISSQLALLGGPPVRTQCFTKWPIFDQAEEKRLLRVLQSGQWGRLQGSEVAEFEERFARMHGCKHGIAVVNGSVSLRISLIAAGLQAEDEVIVPPYTFLSTATSVVEANAVPVFADIDLETFNLDPRAVEAAITPRTRAIIPVHFAGQMAEMDSLMALAKKHQLVVIEDAAHAHCASLANRPAGSLGHFGSFSFQSSKNLTCGEGGIIVTNDDTLAETCRSVQNCGRIPGGVWYEHHIISSNYRLGEFQGAILNCQLERLEAQTVLRDENGQYLTARLSGLPGLHPQQRPSNCTRHSHHLMMLRIIGEEFGAPRPAIIQALQAEGIPCSAGYGYPLFRQPLFQNKAFGPYLPTATPNLDYQNVRCPNSELICQEQCLWLEQSLFLGSRTDMDDIAKAFEKVHANREVLSAWWASRS